VERWRKRERGREYEGREGRRKEGEVEMEEQNRGRLREENCQTWRKGWKMPVRQFLLDKIANYSAFDTCTSAAAENKVLGLSISMCHISNSNLFVQVVNLMFLLILGHVSSHTHTVYSLQYTQYTIPLILALHFSASCFFVLLFQLSSPFRLQTKNSKH
jgi:hypothetical protein